MKSTPKGYNAYVESSGKAVVKLYNTIIVEYDLLNRTIKLNSGGRLTNHTKKCMNYAMANQGYNVSQVKGHWLVTHNSNPDCRIDFIDNMVLPNINVLKYVS
jgi:hypothetical protein